MLMSQVWLISGFAGGKEDSERSGETKDIEEIKTFKGRYSAEPLFISR
jgi:hypothetical protein